MIPWSSTTVGTDARWWQQLTTSAVNASSLVKFRASAFVFLQLAYPCCVFCLLLSQGLKTFFAPDYEVFQLARVSLSRP